MHLTAALYYLYCTTCTILTIGYVALYYPPPPSQITTLGDAESVNYIQVFDTRSNRWSRLPGMPDHRHLLATVQKDDIVYFLGGHRNRYEGKGLVDKDARHECSICFDALDGPIHDPPGRECDGCSTANEVKMKCACGLARYCNKTCQALHWPAHKKVCEAALKSIKAGKLPVAKLVCGHMLHMQCFHELTDRTRVLRAYSDIPTETNVPCPLCRHNIDQSAFYDKREKDTESKLTQRTVAATWSFNMSTGIWSVLADAPFDHDDFFVLEEPGCERIVSVSSRVCSTSLAYTIATDTWETNASSVPRKPAQHTEAVTVLQMMMP